MGHVERIACVSSLPVRLELFIGFAAE